MGLPVSLPVRMFCRAFTALIASPVAFASAASPSWVRVVSSATAGPGSPLSPFSPLKFPDAMPSFSSCRVAAESSAFFFEASSLAFADTSDFFALLADSLEALALD